MTVSRFRPLHHPPIAALRALEAAARHLSFTKAADELHISQSAVSHQIAYLEKLWGIQLFHRRPRRIEPTTEGEALARVVRMFLHELRSTLEAIEGPVSSTDRLKISTTESFALAWLLPRLPNFTQKFKERKPIREYTSLQRRFRHLDDVEIDKLQEQIEERYNNLVQFSKTK